ncbi:MAG: 50S ribosomal protein L17 [Bacteroidota bacterium]
MRHLVKGSKLGRKTGHRKATLRSLACSLIEKHRIQTTVPKAKALRTFIEPIITRAKEDTQHNRRQVFSKLQNKHAVSLLFDEVGPKAKDRPGGYTRVLKTGFRAGDGAEQAMIELVDYNDIKPEGTGGKRKRTRRAGRKKKTTSATPDSQPKKEESNSDEEE